MSSWTGFGSACADPAEASPARGQSPVGNVGGAGSREPLQGLDTSLRIVRITRFPRRGSAGICGSGGRYGWWRLICVFLTEQRYEKVVHKDYIIVLLNGMNDLRIVK